MKFFVNFIKTLSITVLTMSASIASEISVLLYNPPGGLMDVMNRSMIENMEKKGIKTTYQQVQGCKGVESWIKSNPTKPMLMNTFVDDEINRLLNPTNEGVCDVGFNAERVVAGTMITNLTMCSMLPTDKAIDKLTKRKSVIGVVFNPTTNFLTAKGLVDSMKLDSKVVKLQGNPRVIQALVSGDIDFALVNNTHSFVSAGANCFMTTGDKKEGARVGRISLEDISPKNPWVGAKTMMYLYGVNIPNRDSVARIYVDTMNTHPEMTKNLNTGYVWGGQISGKTRDQEWKTEIQSHIDQYTKN